MGILDLFTSRKAQWWQGDQASVEKFYQMVQRDLQKATSPETSDEEKAELYDFYASQKNLFGGGRIEDQEISGVPFPGVELEDQIPYWLKEPLDMILESTEESYNMFHKSDVHERIKEAFDTIDWLLIDGSGMLMQGRFDEAAKIRPQIIEAYDALMAVLPENVDEYQPPSAAIDESYADYPTKNEIAEINNRFSEFLTFSGATVPPTRSIQRPEIEDTMDTDRLSPEEMGMSGGNNFVTASAYIDEEKC